MHTSTACDALRQGCCLELRYHGFTRVVEVHTCGVNTADHDAARVWQVRGGSVHNEPIGWKMFLLQEAVGAVILDESSAAPRRGYKRNDKGFKHIVGQL